MTILDPGHRYALAHLDGDSEEILTFVKREGEGYPGNVGSHPGTNIQEVLRALIDRVKYLDGQISCRENQAVLDDLRRCLIRLEERAAKRHGRRAPDALYLRNGLDNPDVEAAPTCGLCGHIGCFTCGSRDSAIWRSEVAR